MSKKPLLVAVDGGSGNIALRYFDDKGQLHTHIQPSLVRRGQMNTGNAMSSSTWSVKDGSVYSVVTTGRKAELINTCDPLYQTSDAHRVLVIDALCKAGLAGRDVILADTLPASQYYADNGINTALIARKQASLKEPVINSSGTVKAPRVLDVLVYPESVPVYISCKFSDYEGTENPDFEGMENVIIIDIGRFTCDITRLDKDNDIVDRTTSENGIHRMVERLHELLQEEETKLGLSEVVEFSSVTLDSIIKNGFVGSAAPRLADKRIYVEKLIQQAANELAVDIRNDLRDVIYSTKEIDALIIGGGGANWLGGKLPHIPNLFEDWADFVYIPDNPEEAVSRGVHLLMLDEPSVNPEE
ncbi:hypothetical protein C3408_22585 [Candidatus Pantoea alvi]|nr:hypothetical protein C3408_22585 [Pantoea alvi]